MEKDALFEPITFTEVYKFLEQKNNKKFNLVVKSIIGVGTLLFPMYLAKKLNIPEDTLNEFATGATLAGAGVGKIVGDTLLSINELFPKKLDYRQKYMRMQVANYLCMFAAFCDTVEELFVVEGGDIWEGYQLKIYDPDEPDNYEEWEEDVKSIGTHRGPREIEFFLSEMTELFRDHFYLLDFWNEIGDDSDEQRLYFDGLFDSLPEKAYERYEQQVLGLSTNFEPMRNWVVQNLLNTISGDVTDGAKMLSRQIKDIPELVADHTTDVSIVVKDRFRLYGEKYHTLFEDGRCQVEDIFTLSNYRLGSTVFDDEKETVQSIEQLMKYATDQRFLLVTGTYGTGKTTLIKYLHQMYMQCGMKVYSFDALDLEAYVDGYRSERFIEFFNSVCKNDDAIIFIDAIDNVNIPSKAAVEDSLVQHFLKNIFDCREHKNHLTFIISSRPYIFAKEDKGEHIAETCLYQAPDSLYEMKVVYSEPFNSTQVSEWIERYPFDPSDVIDKTFIKDRNGSIITALYNPLFLYIFVKKYEKEHRIRPDAGYYYYYEHFISETIQGKYEREAKFGARAIAEHKANYRHLLQQISFEILCHYSDKITAIIDQERLYEVEPLLDEALQKYRFSLPFNDFSEATLKIYSEIKSKEIDNANFINCYFLKMVQGQVFFTDVNILFCLAAEKIYGQLCDLTVGGRMFAVNDLMRFDAIDFYPQILDYILYKIREGKKLDAFRTYVSSFVADPTVRCRGIHTGVSGKELRETYAQIIMLYVIFIKLNKISYSNAGFQHIFREMMQYINAYKTHCYNTKDVDYVYTVERYLMGTHIEGLVLNRTNLKEFNFKESTIESCKFYQCKFWKTDFFKTKFRKKNVFELCEFKECRFDIDIATTTDKVRFTDCAINQLTLNAKVCSFVKCTIQTLMIDVSCLERISFKDCIITTIKILNANCKGSAKLVFGSCIFKGGMNLSGYNGWIEFTSKCYYQGAGKLFKNIKNESKIPSSELIG